MASLRVGLDSKKLKLLNFISKVHKMWDKKQIVHFKLCCICQNDNNSFTFWVIVMNKKRINNSVFSTTSTVLLRKIALVYNSITTWTLSQGGRLTSIEIFWCVLGEILCFLIIYSNGQSKPFLHRHCYCVPDYIYIYIYIYI